MSSMWPLVLGFWFEWFWELFVATPAGCSSLRTMFSLCVGGKKASFTVCVCWWVEISMISPHEKQLFFMCSLLNTPSSSMGLIIECSFLPWGQNTIMAPQRRTFYVFIFGSQVFRWQFSSQKLSPSCKNQSPTYQEQGFTFPPCFFSNLFNSIFQLRIGNKSHVFSNLGFLG